MRSIEDKGCNNNAGSTPEISTGARINNSFEFHKGNVNGVSITRSSSHHHHRTALGKPTPSKWDDAQKWLVGLSRVGGGGGDKNQKNKPRNSNADDRRLIAPVPQKEQDYSSSEDENEQQHGFHLSLPNNHYESETKKVDCEDNPTSGGIRSICLRDMGTEMTPIASQEPSRAATPIRSSTPVGRSPISSGSSTPVRSQNGVVVVVQGVEKAHKAPKSKDSEQARKLSPLEARAIAWDEAERAKYTARYKREEVKIQAWENHEKRKAEMEMKKMEVKAERLKARAQERMANKIAATRRVAEEKRVNAEAELNEKAVRTCEKADYIRRNGHMPTSFSFKLPSLCW
ncbi:remorin 4.1-like [Tripterygium wilfordii]|uniref:remorin 4.1-like n=1 Tax=Tripterygium wilfordii TaxID=458696 RepID=UPI0018F82660|nr:remorin 4.1-like [Tripterygium wilfordii]XP_038703576.1 remorin 4.1-like [Tripterygium wilfordii]